MSALLKNLRRIGAAVCAASLSLVSTLDATTVTQDFGTQGETPNTMPAGWQVRYRNNTTDTGVLNTAAIIDTIPGTSQMALLLQRTTEVASSNSSVLVSYTGTTGDIVNGQVADFNAEFTLRAIQKGNSTSAGFLFRSASANYSSGAGYYVGFALVSGTYLLGLWQNPVSHVDNGTLLASDPINGFADNVDYTLKIVAVGANISASLWDGETEVASISISDANHLSAGYFGFRSAFGNNGASVAFRNFELQSVPEPSAAALFLPAVSAFLLARRRCSSR